MPFWFGTDLAGQYEIASKYDHVPLQSWSLSSRTLNALLRHNFKMTVGDVIRADENFATIEWLGTSGLQELEAKVSQLLAATHSELKALSLPINQSMTLTNSKASVNSPLKLLPESVQPLPLDQLHLDTKTHKALIKAGINTIGKLNDASNSHIRDILGSYPNSLRSVNRSLITLLNSVNHENEVDWFEYWRHQEIHVVPTTYTLNTSSEQVIESLPAIIEEVLRRELDERSGIIVKRRFGLGNVEKLTLEDIGNAFGGLSRERIRQLEERALKKYKTYLLSSIMQERIIIYIQ